MKVRLNIRTAKGSLYQREYSESLIRVGRDPSNDLQFGADNDDNVSRFHAQLELRQGQLILADLASSNGTYVNNEQVLRPVQVNCGDEIRFGCAGPRATIAEIRSEDSPILGAASGNPIDSSSNDENFLSRAAAASVNERVESAGGPDWTKTRQPTRQLLVAYEFRARNRWLLTVTVVAGLIATFAGGLWSMIRARDATIYARLENEAEARHQAEQKLSSEVARTAREANQTRMEEARIQRELVAKVEEDIKRLANERDQNDRKVQEIEGAIARVIRKSETTEVVAEATSAQERWEQPEARIDCPQENVVLELKSGRHIRGRLEEIDSKAVGLKLPKFKYSFPYKVELVNRILTAEDVYKFDTRRRIFVSGVQYYAYNSVKEVFAPIRDSDPKASLWTREIASMRLVTGQEMPCLFCKLKTGTLGIGLDSGGVDQLPFQDIAQIVTAKGVYTFGSNRAAPEFKSFESIRAEQQEKQFATALVALGALSYGFGRGLGAMAASSGSGSDAQGGSSSGISRSSSSGPSYRWEPCPWCDGGRKKKGLLCTCTGGMVKKYY